MKMNVFAKQSRPGVTLLELILALGLSTVVLAIIGMALSMYYRMFDQRRTTLEESRIARSVLRKVSDDLRSTIQFQPPDLSGLNIVSASMQGQLGDAAASLGALTGGAGGAQGGNNPLSALQGAGGNTTANPNPTGANSNGQNQTPQPAQANATGGNGQRPTVAPAGGNTQSGNRGSGTGANQAAGQAQGAGGAAAQAGSAGSGQDQSGEAAGTTESGQPTSQLGLRGSLYELQIDISRLPRIDEYTALTDPNSPLQVVDIPSDVKTISYFVVANEQEGADVSLKAGEEVRPLRGLFRRERSRALSSLGAPLTMEGVARDNSQLLAEEVTAIEFSYFDGVDWYSDWDSSSMGGLPKAIEIAIEVNMTPPEASSSLDGFSLSATTSDTSEVEPTVYKLVVSLPNDPPLGLPTSEATGDGGMDSGMGTDPAAGTTGQNAGGVPMGGMGQGGMGMGGVGGQAGSGLGGGIGGGGFGGGGSGGQPGQGGQGGRGGRGGGRNGGNGGLDDGNDQGGPGGPGGRGGRGGGPNAGGGMGRGGGGQGFGGRGGQGFGGAGGRGGGGLGGGLGGGGLGGGGIGGRR